MKIPKIKKIDGSQVLIEQAKRIAEVPANADETMQLDILDSARMANKTLTAENVNPVAKKVNISPGDRADVSLFNRFFSDAETDLKSILSSQNAISTGALSTYNILSTKENDLKGKLKTLNRRLQALKLYSQDLEGNKQFAHVSFTDGAQIAQPTSCTYSEEEGALTLPLVTEGLVFPAIKSIEILPGSNGLLGNNSDRSRPRNADIKSLYDGHDHTWFEYEKISAPGVQPLKLVLRLTLDKVTTINHIKINPVNLGTLKWPRLDQISVGTKAGSVDLLSKAVYLDPTTSKYSGLFAVTFAPASTDIIIITLTQDESYPILGGSKHRYAIALREIFLAQLPFNSNGEFTLSEQSFEKPVVAMALEETSSLTDNAFTKISYEVSADSGRSWSKISAKINKDTATPEVLYLDNPTKTVVLRGKIQRIASEYKEPALEAELQTVEKMTSISSASSQTVSLASAPENFVELVELGCGSVGNSASPYFMGVAKSNSAIYNIAVPTPIPREWARVFVNLEEWTQVDAFGEDDAKEFIYNDSVIPNKIEFGDNTTGKRPDTGSMLYLSSKPDTRAIWSGTGPYTADLSIQSDKIKSTTRLYFRDLEEGQTTVVVGPNNNYATFPDNHYPTEILSVSGDLVYSPIADGDETRGDVSGFINGRTEFGAEVDPAYSTDWTGRRLYLYRTLGVNAANVVVTYKYTKKILIKDSDWNYQAGENRLTVTSPLFTPRMKVKVVAASAQRSIQLISDADVVDEVTILRGSVKPLDAEGSGLLRTLAVEVPFIDGASEFLNIQDTILEGYFSVDYKKGLLYIPEGEEYRAGSVQFMYVAAEIEYGIGKKLVEGIDFLRRGQEVELLPGYLNGRAEYSRQRPDRNRLLIRYDTRPSVSLSGADGEQYFTPVLHDVTIVGITSELGTGLLDSI